MERISKEFYVLSRMHEAGMVSEERATTPQAIAELTNTDVNMITGILKTLEQRQLVGKTTSDNNPRFYVSSLGIIIASAIYT
jgi:DNA-binding MarR family transcriptional regulator